MCSPMIDMEIIPRQERIKRIKEIIMKSEWIHPKLRLRVFKEIEKEL